MRWKRLSANNTRPHHFQCFTRSTCLRKPSLSSLRRLPRKRSIILRRLLPRKISPPRKKSLLKKTSPLLPKKKRSKKRNKSKSQILERKKSREWRRLKLFRKCRLSMKFGMYTETAIYALERSSNVHPIQAAKISMLSASTLESLASSVLSVQVSSSSFRFPK